MTRDPRRARVLGLWSAGWLAVFLVAGMVRLGEPAVQWPVLAVPLLWALVALRPRRRPAGARWEDDDPDGYDYDGYDGYDYDGYDPDGYDGYDYDPDLVDADADDRPADRWADRWGDAPSGHRGSPRVRPAERTDTVERSAVRRPSDDDPWEGRRRR